MTYIDYLNAFNQWTENNQLPIASKVMYYGLLHIFNRCMWPEWVQVSNQRLMRMIDTRHELSVIRTRERLTDAGLISYERGKKGSPGKYKLNRIPLHYDVSVPVSDSVSVSVSEPVSEPVSHNKNKNKNKTKTDTPPLSPGGSARETYGMDDEGFALFWQAYPKKQGKIHARKAWDKLVPLARQDILLRQHILDSLERWNRSDEWSRDDGRYIPLPASWLNGRRWEDEVMVKKTIKEQIDELYNHPDEYWTAGGVVPDCEDPWN